MNNLKVPKIWSFPRGYSQASKPVEWPFAYFNSMNPDETFWRAKGGPTDDVPPIFMMPGCQESEIWDFKACLIVGSFLGILSRKKSSVTHTRPGRPVWVTLDFFRETH